jgi:quinolinate synthase
MDKATVINWGSFCGVHTVFTSKQVRNWQEQGWTVLVHPESPLDVVQAADGSGSTDYLWKAIMSAPEGSRLAIGTEGHFVRNAAEQSKSRGVQVRHLTESSGDRHGAEGGCGCATMSRNDPPHLAGMLDLLRRGEAPEINRVLPGDVVDEASGVRERLDGSERDDLVRHARSALERMIDITESNSRYD